MYGRLAALILLGLTTVANFCGTAGGKTYSKRIAYGIATIVTGAVFYLVLMDY